MSHASLRVLITDDETDSLEWLRAFFETGGHEVRVSNDARTAEMLCHLWRPDLVLADLVLPDIDGLTLLRRLRQRLCLPHVIIVSGHATIRSTVEALGAGAMSVLEKPVDPSLLRGLVARVVDERYGDDLAHGARPVEQLGSLISRDPRMLAMFDTVRRAAPTLVNVLIQGENGAGKELVASALHDLSPRAGGPFIKVNCAAIPGELLESELFGHRRGAFTDAHADKKGLFELSHHGSILLDEVAEMPPSLQVKLLRVLQERELRPVGSTTSIKTDFRLICATNVDSGRAVAEGRLRQDLFFRLNTIALHVPPLRERAGDVRLLAEHFLARFAAAYDRRIGGFADAALRLLEGHAWPGNVRELEHAVERAVILTRGDEIRAEDLPDSLRARQALRSSDVSLPAGCSLEEIERLAILHTLELMHWNKRATAKVLGIHRPTLYNKLRKYGLWRREDRFRHEIPTARTG